MANDYITLFSSLTTIGIWHDNIIWSSPSQFAQRNIAMNFVSSDEYVKLLDRVIRLVKSKPKEYCCVFVGSKLKMYKLVKALEEKLNKKNC